MKSSTLYYLSAIPIAIGVLMAFKAGEMSAREKTWDEATTPPEVKE